MSRKLEVTIDTGRIVRDLPLPEGWDEMTPEQQQEELDEAIETVKWNYVGGDAKVVER